MPWVEPDLTEEVAGWEEVYGPDYPFTPGDVPVIGNGLCRVRYDATNTPGFLIEVWNASDDLLEEQGKVCLLRNDESVDGAGTNPLDTLISASLVEYTQDRAVVGAVMAASGDALSRELVYITLQRGWTGPRFEVYTAGGTDGSTTDVGATVLYTVHDADVNDTAMLVGATTAHPTGTAGSGSSVFPSAGMGSGFDGENWVHLLREGSPYAVALAVLQAAVDPVTLSNTEAYGVARNAVSLETVAGGYVSFHIGFYPVAADQVMEAEAIRNSSSGTTSIVADATASGGQCVKDTQTANTHHTLSQPATSLMTAKYRVTARVKVDAGATGSFVAQGVTAISTSTTWTWVDLGDVTTTSAAAVNVNTWRSAGSSGGVYIDRVESALVEDRVQSVPGYAGARDLGQSALADIRPETGPIARG